MAQSFTIPLLNFKSVDETASGAGSNASNSSRTIEDKDSAREKVRRRL
jgi:hypothetical protein